METHGIPFVQKYVMMSEKIYIMENLEIIYNQLER